MTFEFLAAIPIVVPIPHIEDLLPWQQSVFFSLVYFGVGCFVVGFLLSLLATTLKLEKLEWISITCMSISLLLSIPLVFLFPIFETLNERGLKIIVLIFAILIVALGGIGVITSKIRKLIAKYHDAAFRKPVVWALISSGFFMVYGCILVIRMLVD